MFERSSLRALLFVGLAIPFIGCGSSQVDTIQVTPATQALASGKSVQFTALGTIGHAGHATKNITATVGWSSSDTTIATISAAGIATGVSPGIATITASTPGFGGTVTGTATITVTGQGVVGANYASIAVIPTSQQVATLQETGQFLAVATTSTGALEDVTNEVEWISSDTLVGTVNSSGLATGLNFGTTTITAIAKNPDGSILTATGTFEEEDLGGVGTQIATLTVYKVGNTASTGTVTTPLSGASGPPYLINCGTGTGCVGTYTVGSTVTLTATPASGATFSGWSANCTVNPSTPNQCTVVLSNSDSVGAIFN